MLRTDLFETKYLQNCYDLQKFLVGKNITINIYSDYITVKSDFVPTEFLFIEYPKENKLLIEYWIDSNNIKFYKESQ